MSGRPTDDRDHNAMLSEKMGVTEPNPLTVPGLL